MKWQTLENHPDLSVSSAGAGQRTRGSDMGFVTALVSNCKSALDSHSMKTIIFSSFHRIFLENFFVVFCSGNFEAVRRACPGHIRKLLRSRTKTHC